MQVVNAFPENTRMAAWGCEAAAVAISPSQSHVRGATEGVVRHAVVSGLGEEQVEVGLGLVPERVPEEIHRLMNIRGERLGRDRTTGGRSRVP